MNKNEWLTLQLSSGGAICSVLSVLEKQRLQVLKQAVFMHVGALLLSGGVLGMAPSHALQPHVVEVPAGPAFVKLPGASEINAHSGQSLKTNALLRTAKPGRMQVMLGNGRQFRMGGDAQLRLGASNVELLKGSLIGWIKPGTPRLNPFKIKTRLATASIQGTTVFLELTDQQFKVFSWEGTVQVETSNGRRFTLKSGQQLLLDLKRQMDEVSVRVDGLEATLGQLGSGIVTPPTPGRDGSRSTRSREKEQPDFTWEPPQAVSTQDAERRLQKSLLINGFSTPLETLPDIQRELGVSAPAP